jgi:SAM-dependent methyltransferase
MAAPAQSPIPLASPHRGHDAFGDDAAARRSALLAALFEPSTARLLRVLAYRRPRNAVDLACGDGWSTRLVHAFLAPGRTVGLDRSPAHVARASAVAPPGVQYAVHDVAAVPLPGPRADFIYGRFSLARVRSPAAALAAWAAAAAPGGAVLALEEVAEISCPHSAFARYYELARDLRAARGRPWRVGATLAPTPESGWTSEIDLRTELSLPAAQMARLHALDLAAWYGEPHARAAIDPGELDGLAAELAAVAGGRAPAPPVGVAVRQLVLAREP